MFHKISQNDTGKEWTFQTFRKGLTEVKEAFSSQVTFFPHQNI